MEFHSLIQSDPQVNKKKDMHQPVREEGNWKNSITDWEHASYEILNRRYRELHDHQDLIEDASGEDWNPVERQTALTVRDDYMIHLPKEVTWCRFTPEMLEEASHGQWKADWWHQISDFPYVMETPANHPACPPDQWDAWNEWKAWDGPLPYEGADQDQDMWEAAWSKMFILWDIAHDQGDASHDYYDATTPDRLHRRTTI